MKITKCICFLFLVSMLNSCSSDSNSNNNANIPPANTATLSVNGAPVTLSTNLAQRSENTLAILANASDGSFLEIDFDAFGNLSRVAYDDSEGNSFATFKHFSSNYFTFNLLSVDSANKTVAVSYSGKVYSDEEDLDSEFKTVSGSFNLSYILQTPSITGLGLSCKIAGSDWHETTFWDNGWNSVDRKYISDDNNQIIMTFGSEDIPTGNYPFNNSSANKIQLAKYDPATGEYKVYIATAGNLSITYNDYVNFTTHIIAGTFSFTATNPNNSADVIQVTNGTFKNNF